MSKVSGDKKAEDSKQIVHTLEMRVKELETDITAMSRDLIKTKQKYGDALNVCLENGGPDLVDKIIRAGGSS